MEKARQRMQLNSNQYLKQIKEKRSGRENKKNQGVSREERKKKSWW